MRLCEKSQQTPKEGLRLLLSGSHAPRTQITQCAAVRSVHHTAVTRCTRFQCTEKLPIHREHAAQRFVKQSIFIAQIVTIFSPPCIG